MKKTFRIMSLIILLMFSFFLTNKIKILITDLDSIMINIKKDYKKYEKKGHDAVVFKEKMIPGISKKKINIISSYRKMRKYGSYNKNYYIYDTVKPDESIENNKNKYIYKGNILKKMVSINFIISDTKTIKNLILILNKHKVKATFFVNEIWISKNLELANLISKLGYTIGIDKIDDYKYMKTILKKVLKEKNIYCKYYDKNSVKKCEKVNGYSIEGVVVNNDFYKNTSINLYSGLIISYTDKSVEKELDNIILYIKKKGFTITDLDTHIIE